MDLQTSKKIVALDYERTQLLRQIDKLKKLISFELLSYSYLGGTDSVRLNPSQSSQLKHFLIEESEERIAEIESQINYDNDYAIQNTTTGEELDCS